MSVVPQFKLLNCTPSSLFLRNSMRADTLSTSNIKNRIGNKLPAEKFADVRHLLDEKRQHTRPRPAGSSTKTGIVHLCFWALSRVPESRCGRGRFLNKTLPFGDQINCPDSSLINFGLGTGT